MPNKLLLSSQPLKMFSFCHTRHTVVKPPITQLLTMPSKCTWLWKWIIRHLFDLNLQIKNKISYWSDFYNYGIL